EGRAGTGRKSMRSGTWGKAPRALGKDGLENPQEIPAQDLFDAGLVISTRQQRFRKGGQAANIFEPDGGAVDAVEVRTEPHVVRSNQVPDVVDVAHHVFQGGGPIAAQELGAKVHAH